MKKILCFFQLFVLLLGLVHLSAYAADRKKRPITTEPGIPRAPRSKGGIGVPHPGAPGGAAPTPSSPATPRGRPTAPAAPRGGPVAPRPTAPAAPRGGPVAPRPAAPPAPRGGPVAPRPAAPPTPRVPRGGEAPRGATKRLAPGRVVVSGATLPPASVTSGVAVASVNAGVISGNVEMTVIPDE